MKLPRKQKKEFKKTCQPLIIVFYVNVGNISIGEVREYMLKVKGKMTSNDKSIKEYFVAVREESRVECLNPVRINNKVYKQAVEKLEKAQEKFDKIMKNENKLG